MKWSNEEKKQFSLLIEQMHLPNNFLDVVQNAYLPLANNITGRLQDGPLFVSISGAQGTGKSTLTTFLKHILELKLRCHVAELSIDNFYLTRNERQQLADRVHPLFVTRGVPGTHDITLIESTLHALINQKSCRVPRFDKVVDDRCDESDWTDYSAPATIILFEGWCNHSPVQTREELVEPVNELERYEDAQGVWRDYANEQLKEYHRKIFKLADMCVFLKAPDFGCVYEWRSLQERKLENCLSEHEHMRVMNNVELNRFIQHYERITRHSLRHLPEIADTILPVAADHSLSSIIENDAHM